MHINKIVFLSFLFFSNLSYSDNNNQQLLIKVPKKVEAFLVRDINDVEKTISNAENNHGLDVDELVVQSAYVGKNMVLKRGRPRARGRYGRIFKPFSQITIVVRENREKE